MVSAVTHDWHECKVWVKSLHSIRQLMQITYRVHAHLGRVQGTPQSQLRDVFPLPICVQDRFRRWLWGIPLFGIGDKNAIKHLRNGVCVSQSELFFQLQIAAHCGSVAILLKVSANQSSSFNCSWLPAMGAAIFEAIFWFSPRRLQSAQLNTVLVRCSNSASGFVCAG